MLFAALALAGVWFVVRPFTTSRHPARWHDPVFEIPVDRPIPYFTLVAYRAALEAGLRWHTGVEVEAADRPDRSPVATWTVRVGGVPRRFALHFRFDGAGTVLAEATGPHGRTELRRWKAEPHIDPVASASHALDDLPAVEKLLGLPAMARGRADAPAGERAGDRAGDRSPGAAAAASEAAALPTTWTPGGIEALAEALLPLGQDHASASPAALARAARALAWQALMDARLAPALAPTRAAQAIALAAVAERRIRVASGSAGAAGGADFAGALADIEVARWLAPPAACGDFWVLARKDPPAGAPELAPLADSYRGFELPQDRPASWNLPQLIGLTERAVALDAAWAVPRLLKWSAGSPWSGLAARYIAMTGELGAVTRHAARCLRGPVSEGARARVPGLPRVPPELARLIGPEFRRVADHLQPLAEAPFASLLAHARGILEAAARAPSFRERVLLEEVGEQLLHGLAPVSDLADHHRWTQPRQALARAIASARFNHPAITSISERLPGDEAPRLEPPPLRSLLARFPGLGRLRPWERQTSRRPSWTIAFAQLALFGAYPAVVFHAAHSPLDTGTGVSTVLVDWLQRRHGPLAPLAGDTVPFSEVERAWRAGALPEPARATPGLTALLARRLRAVGQLTEARNLLDPILIREPACEPAVIELVRTACAAGDLTAAREAARAMSSAAPAGIAWARVQAELADGAVGHDRNVALLAARTAASSMDEDLIAVHARVAAVLGAAEELESALSRLHLADPSSDRERSARAVCALTSAAHRNVPIPRSMWDAVNDALHPPGPRTAAQLDQMLRASKVPVPSTPDLVILRCRIAICALRARAPGTHILLADLRALTSDSPEFEEDLHDLRLPWLDVLARFLTGDDPVSDAELSKLANFTGQPCAEDAGALLERMDAAGATADRLARTAARLARIVPRADAAGLSWAATSPSRARLWTSLARFRGSPHAEVDVARWLDLNHRPEEARDLRDRLPHEDREEDPMVRALVAPYAGP